MRWRSTVLLLAVCLGLGVYILTVERRLDGTRARQEKARRAFSIRADEVRALRLQTETLDLACVYDGQRWTLQRPAVARADAGEIERILTGLESLARGAVITPREQRRLGLDLKAYGLDPPAATLELDDGARRQRYAIGRVAPFGDAVYVACEATGDIVAADTNLLALLPTSVDRLRDRDLVSLRPDRVRRIDLRNPSGFVQLARNPDGRWFIKQPIESRADHLLVDTLLAEITSAQIAAFVDDEVSDFAPYGCDPESAITLSLTARREGEIQLALGRPMETDTNWVYARLNQEPAVYGVPLALREHASRKAMDLRDRRLTALQPAEVDRITLRENERVLVFEREADGWRIEQPRRWPAANERVEDLTRKLCAARIERFIDDPQTAGAIEPSRVFTLEGRPDPKGRRAALVVRVDRAAGESGRLRVAVEGEPTLYEVRPDDLPAPPFDPLNYRDLTVLRLRADDVTRVSVARGDINQAAERNENGVFVCNEPMGFLCDEKAMRALLGACEHLRARAFVAENPADLTPYGLQPPSAVVSIGFQSGRGIGKTLLLGAVREDGDSYAMIRGQDLVFTLSPLQRERLTPVLCRPNL